MDTKAKDDNSSTTQSSSESLLKAFDPEIDDMLYMDMSGGSRSPCNSPWTSHNVELYMNSPKLSPRSRWFLNIDSGSSSPRPKSPVAKQLWKSTDKNLRIPGSIENLDAKSDDSESEKPLTETETSVTDIFLTVPPKSHNVANSEDVSMDIRDINMDKSFSIIHDAEIPKADTFKDTSSVVLSDSACDKNEVITPIKNKNCDIEEHAAKVIYSLYDVCGNLTDNTVQHTPTVCKCSPESATKSESPIYLTPHCNSCSKMLDRDKQQQKIMATKNDTTATVTSECDMNATYMSITGIQDLGASPITTTITTTQPPELPQRNSSIIMSQRSDMLINKMCRCRELRKQAKRTLHLEDVIEGPGPKVYCVKDIVESVDELIGAFCEDDVGLSKFAIHSTRKSHLHNLLRKPSFNLRDHSLLRRTKNTAPPHNGDKRNSKDSGFESDGHKNKPILVNSHDGHKNKAISVNSHQSVDRCMLKDCSNCQEYESSVNTRDCDDGGTLDCYSYAHSKRLTVEAYKSIHPKQCLSANHKHSSSESTRQLSTGSQSSLNGKKSLREYIPSVAPKLSEVSDSAKNLVSKANKLKQKPPFSFGRYSFRSQKLAGTNFSVYNDTNDTKDTSSGTPAVSIVRANSDRSSDSRAPLKDLNNNGNKREAVLGRKAVRLASAKNQELVKKNIELARQSSGKETAC